MNDGSIQPKEDRAAILVSSTSWTPDEDFSILLEALKLYEKTCCKTRIVCLITGKGALKDHYEEIISQLELQKVQICLLWLQPEDYPRLLSSADLGVCLHTSSSGLDLPMKVVDMFGSHLPVAAFSYKCLDELVLHDVNGYHFTTSHELSQQLSQLLSDFPNKTETLNRFRNHLENNFTRQRWEDNWEQKVSHLFER